MKCIQILYQTNRISLQDSNWIALTTESAIHMIPIIIGHAGGADGEDFAPLSLGSLAKAKLRRTIAPMDRPTC
jgi:hypothetical protein